MLQPARQRLSSQHPSQGLFQRYAVPGADELGQFAVVACQNVDLVGAHQGGIDFYFLEGPTALVAVNVGLDHQTAKLFERGFCLPAQFLLCLSRIA